MIHRRGRIFDRHRGHRLYVGRDSHPGHGPIVGLGPGSSERWPAAEAVNREDGARDTFTSGQELFVPAHHGIGRR